MSKKANNPYELFEFFLENYKVIPKEQLLRLMQGSSHAGALLQMDQVDLAIEYAERCVSAVIKQPTADVSPQNNQPLLFRRFQEGRKLMLSDKIRCEKIWTYEQNGDLGRR